MFTSVFSQSLLSKAQKQELVEIKIVNLRDFGRDHHQTVDDRPYGGGSGMILKVDVVVQAIVAQKKDLPAAKVILLSPQGQLFNQKIVKRLVRAKELILVCGHYEGVDERIPEFFVDEEISIGNYILTGGEIPAMALCDSIIRLVPGVVAKKDSLSSESLEGNLLKYPQYTRPDNFQGHRVPKILFSGNHLEIAKWRREQSLKKTAKKRPDLFLKIKTPQRD